MKSTEITAPNKSYDAIEDALELSKQDPSKTWDDLLRKRSERFRGSADKREDENSEQRGKVAACAQPLSRIWLHTIRPSRLFPSLPSKKLFAAFQPFQSVKSPLLPGDRLCVVKLIDAVGVTHEVRVRAESIYEAALLGLNRLERVGWESDGSQVGRVTVEVWEEPTRDAVDVRKLLSWLKAPGKFQPEEQRKAKLRVLVK